MSERRGISWPQRVVRRLGWSFFAVVLLAPALHAQSMQTLSPQECVWHAGDNPAWAAANFEDSAWQPYSTWKLDENTPRLWVRCHTNLAPLRSLAHPALQVRVRAASQVFVNGTLAGSSGNVADAHFTLATFYTVPLAPDSLNPQTTIALRLAMRDYQNSGDPAEILLGDWSALEDHHAAAALSGALGYLPIAICFGLIGIVGFMLLGLYVSDRSHRELLLLASICWLLCDLRLSEFCQFALVPLPYEWFNMIYGIGQFLEIFWVWFMFAIAGKRIPWFYRVLIVITVVVYSGNLLISPFLSPLADFHQQAFYLHIARYAFVGGGLCASAPMVAFWPWTRIPRGQRVVAFFCIAWGFAEFLWFMNWELWAFGLETSAGNLMAQKPLLIMRATTTLCSVLALLTILFREQRRVAQERAQLAGEMASAREIQEYLIPDTLPATPGLKIRSVYQPSREVGGDFFQILPDARDGSTLIVIGDVAGKGLQAGMLAALIVGAIRTAFKFTSDPGEILALLNERLQGRGLVTCLAMRIDADGNVELANAGHLPPYIDGKELALEGALPLGAMRDTSFPVRRLQVEKGASMLLVSDGVIEAQSASGELFGFERTRIMSIASAEEIAAAAQAHGQQDDITVVTVEVCGVRQTDGVWFAAPNAATA